MHSPPQILHPCKVRPAVPLPLAQTVLSLQPPDGVTSSPPPAVTLSPAAPSPPIATLQINNSLHPLGQPPVLDPDEEELFWGAGPVPVPHQAALAEEAEDNSQQAPQRPLDPPLHQAPLPSFQEASQTYIPTLKWPPRSVRADFTRTAADLWQQVADRPDDLQGWLLILIFPRAILPARMELDRGGEGESKAKMIKERLRRWRQGEYSALWKEAVQLISSRGKRKKKVQPLEKSQQELNVERATKLCQEGQYTKALQSLVSLGLADHTAESLREMKAKHPASPPPIIPTTDSSPMAFSPSQVLEACKTFHKGSGPGPSGLRPEHLMIMLKSSPANRVAKAETQLTRLVNAMSKGAVPAVVSPHLCGARLIAANKKTGGLRPIAVGNILRRLTSKLIARGVSDRMAPLLSPHQAGVCIKGGCEAVIHTVREAVVKNPDKWVLQVDLENAFNRVSRNHVLSEVANLLPDCLPWAVTCYGRASNLQFGKTSLSSSSGVQQGDPFASICFALVLQPVIEAIQSEVPTLVANAWLHDDGTVVGTVEELMTVVAIVQRDGPERGLHLQPDKSSIWSPSPPAPGVKDPLGCGIKLVEEAGIKLLGAPIGSSEFVAQFVKKKVEKIKTITSLLPSLHQPHLEFVLLRSCLSLPKIVYILRTTDPSLISDLLLEFDSTSREALSCIIGGPLSDLSWQQAKLPISMGGVGLRAAEDHAAAAFSTSLLSSQPLLRSLLHREEEDAEPALLSASLLDQLSAKTGAEEPLSTESILNTTQKMLSAKIDLRNLQLLQEALKAAGSVREVARLASVSLKDAHAGDFLTVVPSPGLGLLLHSSEFVTALRYRLGHPVFGSDGPCPACGKHSDRLGDHAMNCAWQGERISRHNSLRDTLHHTAVKAALGPTKEGQYLLPGEGGKPADIFIPRHAGGKDCALDVTVVNPLQAALVAQAAETPGHALKVAHKRKLDKSWQACNQQGIVFLPLAVESLGAWHKSAVSEIKKLGSTLARHTGEEETTVTLHLFQQLSIALVKGNAALLNNRKPSDSSEGDEGFGW